MKTKKIILIFGILAAFFVACTGEKGAIGPQGVAGQQGAKGDKGDTGASGEFPKTQTGSFTIKITDWKTNTVSTTDDAYYFTVPVKEVTKDVLDKGIVSVLWLFTADQPVFLPYDRVGYKVLYSVFLEKGEGRIRVDIYPSAATKAGKPTTDMPFRWIINN